MKRILVLGGAGYIGSHVVRKLKLGRFRPVIFDNLSTGHRESVAGEELIEGDVRNYGDLDRLFGEGEIDAVMHFSAMSLVAESMRRPGDYFDNNVAGGLNLLRAMKKHGVKKIIFSSTAATYGQPENIPITESDTQDPVNPYGESKLMFEKMLKWYDRVHDIRSVVLRYFNAAGADDGGEIGEDHDPETHLIPVIFEVINGKRECLEIYGDDYSTPDGTCIRDYIHVYDLAEAHILALDHLFEGGESAVYNMGCGRGYSVKEVVEMAESVTGKPVRRRTAPRRVGDPAVLVASSERINRDMGWAPAYDLRGIIETAWKWHGSHPMGYRKDTC